MPIARWLVPHGSVLVLSLGGLALAGCGSENAGPADAAAIPPDLTPPPAICKSPPPLPSGWFTDITTRVLPSATDAKTAPTAGSVRAGDLDGDGYPDLITTGEVGRRDAATRFVFMNRPDPADPSGRTRIFVDGTAASHVLDTRDGKGGRAFSLASIGDVDNDGDVDLVLGPSDPGVDHEPDDPGGVLLNDGHGHFSIADSGEIETSVVGFASSTATLFDFDADGALDWLPGTFTYPPPNLIPPMLFKGQGNGRFSDVTMQYGIRTEFGSFQDYTNLPAMYGLTACDLDMDGDQDILFADYGREPNQIWRNDGDHFTEIGRDIGLAFDDRMDFSDDQSYRCYCKNRPGVCTPQPPPPYDPGYCTFAGGKDGRGWIPGDSDQPWRLGGNNYSLVCGDIDNDGDMDVMTSTIRHADVGSASDPSELCLNDAPPGGPLSKFRRPGGKATGIDRSKIEVGYLWNEGDLTAQMVDVDNDGLKDVYLCSSDYPGDHGWLFHQRPDHTFEDATTAARLGQKQAHGIAFFDFDRDGDLDVAIGTSTARAGAPYAVLRIYENKVGQDRNWLQVELVGRGKGGTNRSAIGALVQVTAGGVTQMQEVSGGHSASATQNELVLTFGLGTSCAVDRVEVRWLDGRRTVSTFTQVRANYRVRITEGQAQVEYL